VINNKLSVWWHPIDGTPQSIGAYHADTARKQGAASIAQDASEAGFKSVTGIVGANRIVLFETTEQKQAYIASEKDFRI